jgi:hypothetical protein
MLYKAMVRSHLEYAVTVWYPYKKGDIKTIEKVQMRATKLISKLKSRQYSDRLRYLKLPTLKYRRLRGDMIETYKILHGLYDNDATINIPLYDSQQITRNNTLKIQNTRCHYEFMT